MTTQSLSPRARIILSLLAIAPALLMVVVGSSAWWAPANAVYGALARVTADPQALRLFNLVSPVVIFGGLGLAFALQIWPAVRFSLRKEGDEWVSQLRVKADSAGIIIVGIAAALGLILLAYLLGENWQCLIALKVSC